MSVAHSPWSHSTSDALEIHLLGLVDFDSALALQQQIAAEIALRDDRRGVLLICEHPPLITVGREGGPTDLLADAEELRSRRIPLRWIGRGGSVVVHGPGQLACYPVIPLQRLGLAPRDLKSRLERAIIDVCGDLQLPAFTRDGVPGVWCRNGRLADLGLSVENQVSSHGVFLNVSNPLGAQRMIRVPPGERVTSLAAERHSGSLMHKVRTALVQRVAGQLGYAQRQVSTGHPRLRRTMQKVPVHA